MRTTVPPIQISNFRKSVIAFAVAAACSSQATAIDLTVKDETYDLFTPGFYASTLDSKETYDSISFHNIEFGLGNNELPASTSSGVLKIGHFDGSISSITLSDIKQTSDMAVVGIDGIHIAGENGSLQSNVQIGSINVNGLSTQGALSEANGVNIGSYSSVTYNKITISNVTSKYWGAQGLLVRGSTLNALDSTSDGTIKIQNITGFAAYGANFENGPNSSQVSGKNLIIDTVTAKGESPYWPFKGSAHGLNVGIDTIFDNISIANITSEGSSYGVDVDSSSDLTVSEELIIKNVQGSTSEGLRIWYDGDLEQIVKTTSAKILNIGGTSADASTSNLSFGVEVNGNIWEGTSAQITGIYATDSGEAAGLQFYTNGQNRGRIVQKSIEIASVSGGDSYGIRNAISESYTPDIETDPENLASNPVLTFNSETIDINGITGAKSAFGIYNANINKNKDKTYSWRDDYDDPESPLKTVSYFNTDSLQMDAKETYIHNVQGKELAFGLYSARSSFNSDYLEISNVSADSFSAGISAEDKSDVSVKSAFIDTSNSSSKGYNGSYSEYRIEDEDDASSVNVTSVALRAVSGSSISLGTDGNQTVGIYGTIVAGRGTVDTQGSSVGESKITLGSTDGSTIVKVYGDVYAGNGGTVNLTLGKGSILEGQVDDYHELDSTQAGTVFRNSAFVNLEDKNAGTGKDEEISVGDRIPVTAAGTATIKLDGGTWIARGQSFVRNVAFGSQGGRIDLTRNENSSVSIENLSGQGQFDMTLGAYTEGTDEIKSDMLYVQNVGAGSSFTIAAHLADGVNVEDLTGLRFATVGSVEGGHSSNLFKVVQITDQGFKNWNLDVVTEDYQSGDEDNARFNGDSNGEGAYKPGEDAIDAIFGDDKSRDNVAVNDLEPRAANEGSQNYIIGGVQKGSTISDAGQAVIATARGLYYNAVEIDRFNQRYGDRRYDENNKSLWMRVRHDRWGTAAGVGDFKSQNTTYQVGFDYTDFVDSGKMIYGAAIDFMDGNTDYESISGSGQTKRYAASAYATYMGDNGSYLDMIGKVGRLSNEYAVKLDSGAGVSADYMNWITALSVEAGHQFTSEGSSWFAEPQIQAQYVYVSNNDYSNGQTQIDQDAIHSFITRAGFRIGRWLDENKGANVYAKADVLHEWAGEQDIHVKDKTTAVGGETFEINNHGTWFDVGLGFQAPIGESFYAYGDAEYRFGNDLDQTWTFNFGGKFVF